MDYTTALTLILTASIVAFGLLPATTYAKKRYGFDDGKYCPVWRVFVKAVSR